MSISNHKKGELVVSIASIAAELTSVKTIAWEVSIASKNAMVIAAQAGAKALGFQPIASFIDEIAANAMEGVTKINSEALKVSRLAVEEIRARDADTRFQQVINKSGEARFISSLETTNNKVRSNLLEFQRVFRLHFKRLVEMLDELDENMQAASSVVSVCRIEASRTEEYRDNLNVVADNLSASTATIKQRVNECYHRLNDISLLSARY